MMCEPHQKICLLTPLDRINSSRVRLKNLTNDDTRLEIIRLFKVGPSTDKVDYRKIAI